LKEEQTAEEEVKRIKHEKAEKKRLEKEFQKKVAHARHEKHKAEMGKNEGNKTSLETAGEAEKRKCKEERKLKELEALMGVESEESEEEELDPFEEPAVPLDPLGSLVDWIAGADNQINPGELLEVANGGGTRTCDTRVQVHTHSRRIRISHTASASPPHTGPGALEIRRTRAAKAAEREREYKKKLDREDRKKEHALSVGGRWAIFWNPWTIFSRHPHTNTRVVHRRKAALARERMREAVKPSENLTVAEAEEVCRCPQCCNVLEDPVRLACGHAVCRECVLLIWLREKRRLAAIQLQNEKNKAKEEKKKRLRAKQKVINTRPLPASHRNPP
jgi:hypothetical protein